MKFMKCYRDSQRENVMKLVQTFLKGEEREAGEDLGDSYYLAQ